MLTAGAAGSLLMETISLSPRWIVTTRSMTGTPLRMATT
jgi:hypothetical protein